MEDGEASPPGAADPRQESSIFLGAAREMKVNSSNPFFCPLSWLKSTPAVYRSQIKCFFLLFFSNPCLSFIPLKASLQQTNMMSFR
jgi:hypothetical protein